MNLEININVLSRLCLIINNLTFLRIWYGKRKKWNSQEKWMKWDVYMPSLFPDYTPSDYALLEWFVN